VDEVKELSNQVDEVKELSNQVDEVKELSNQVDLDPEHRLSTIINRMVVDDLFLKNK
jgi:hypothetical protein